MARATKSLLILAVTALLGQATLAGSAQAGSAQAGSAQAGNRSGSAAPSRGSNPGQTRSVDVIFRTPRYRQNGTHAKALRRADASDATADPNAAPVLVYLNASGSVITGGADNPARNTSWIAASAGWDVRFPAYSGSAASWQAITACVRDGYRDFAVDFTDQRPNGATYSMIVVGGSPSLLGLDKAVGGIAPSDSEVLRNAVGFVFSASSGNRVDDVCEAIVHEVGHTLGLDHGYRCEDPMSYLNGCGPKRFADVAAPCGEYQARRCDGGAATQNSYRSLMSLVGGRSTSVTAQPPLLPPVTKVNDSDADVNVSDPDVDDSDPDVDDSDAEAQGHGNTHPYNGYNQDSIEPEQQDDAWSNEDSGDNTGQPDLEAGAIGRSADDHGSETQCPHQQTSSNRQSQPRSHGRRGQLVEPGQSSSRRVVTQSRTVHVTRVTRLWMRDRSGAWQLVSVRTR